MKFNFKGLFVLAICLFSFVIVIPNFLPSSFQNKFPGFIKNNLIKLGLDLKGGAYILLEVDLDGIKKDKLSLLEDNMRSILRGNRSGNRGLIQYSNLTGIEKYNIVSFKIRDVNKINEVEKRIRNDFGDDLTISSDDMGMFKVSWSDTAFNKIVEESVDKAIEIVRRRIDSLGTSELSIQKHGNSRIMVQLPGVDNPDSIKHLIGKTAKMTFHKVNESVTDFSSLPVGTELLPSFDSDNLYYTPVYKKVEISGEHLKDSKATQDSYGRPAVSTVFDNVGSMKFAKLTRENVGHRFAIVLDGRVLSAPVIQEEIPSGQGIISGSFTYEQVANLSLLLRSGALPAPLSIVEERVVGAGLGSDSIEDGKFASILGLCFVIFSMFLFYGKLGIVSDFVLILNLVIILSAMGVFGFVMTLPGIAGLVLTMGMSVDAAVIIFERMREEYIKGASSLYAVEQGFKSAFVTIMDSNITTLVSAVLLFHFGSGPVRGFAVTLGVGIISSMFCFVIVLKRILLLWAKKSKNFTLPFNV